MEPLPRVVADAEPLALDRWPDVEDPMAGPEHPEAVAPVPPAVAVPTMAPVAVLPAAPVVAVPTLGLAVLHWMTPEQEMLNPIEEWAYDWAAAMAPVPASVAVPAIAPVAVLLAAPVDDWAYDWAGTFSQHEAGARWRDVEDE